MHDQALADRGPDRVSVTQTAVGSGGEPGDEVELHPAVTATTAQSGRTAWRHMVSSYLGVPETVALAHSGSAVPKPAFFVFFAFGAVEASPPLPGWGPQ
jgi:hypothetical protein